MILADRRVFAVMAFLNAAGYDKEAKGQQMHPARSRVRTLVEEKLKSNPRKLEAWRKYYKSKRLASFHYVDFALSLSADYPFHRIRPDKELGYPQLAKTLKEFPGLLNDFWVTAGLDEIWSQVKLQHTAELKKYDFQRMARKLAYLWQFLRMKRADSYVLVNIPNLLDKRFTAQGARYENYYYSIESPGSHSYDLNTHEYLHSFVNRMVRANYGKQAGKLDEYYRAGKDQPMAETYRERVGFASECLVRALDHRVRANLAADAAEKKRLEDLLARWTADGLTLAQPFYVLLNEYEKSDLDLAAFLPILLERLPRYTP